MIFVCFRISSGVVWQSSDLQLSSNTLYLLSPRLCFSIVFSDVSLYVCSYYFSSVKVDEGPSFGKKLLTRLTLCPLYILTILFFVISRFGYDGGSWLLIAPITGHCMLVFLLLFFSLSLTITIRVSDLFKRFSFIIF